MTRIADSLNKVIPRSKPWAYGGTVTKIASDSAPAIRAALPEFLTDKIKKQNREAIAKMHEAQSDDDR